jgi:hypothetical protein
LPKGDTSFHVDLAAPLSSITRETRIFLFFLSSVHLLPYLENRIEDGFLSKRECNTKDIIPFHTWAAVQLMQEIQILSRLEAPKRHSKLYKYHVLLLQEEERRVKEHRRA